MLSMQGFLDEREHINAIYIWKRLSGMSGYLQTYHLPSSAWKSVHYSLNQ